MFKTISVFFLLIFLIPCNAQDITKTPGDSLIIYKDSLGIFNDTLSTSDTTGILSEEINKPKGDSLVPLFTRPLSRNNYIITAKEIQFFNYRSTEDMLELNPFYYSFRYGSIGYGSRNYSMGTHKIGFLQNGVPIASNRYSSTDLSDIQSENIDSVEFIPVPRSGLFNYRDDYTIINIITKDQLWVRPYTRIKYYQGADGEAMFDGIFNSVLYKSLYGYLDVTNRTYDGSYANSAFNSWQVTAKLRYLFSNDLNITASYSYAKLYKGLNGGVDVDSTGVDNDVIFNPFQVPVNYYSQDRDQKLHNYDIKFLAKPFENLFTDASFYYHFHEENDNNVRDIVTGDDIDKENITGMMLRTYYDIKNYFNLNLNLQYEKQKQSNRQARSFQSTGKVNVFYFSSILDLQFSDIIKPSLYYKYSQDNNVWEHTLFELIKENYDFKYYNNCIGGDIKILPMDNMIIYAGYSANKLSFQSLNTFQISASWIFQNLYLLGEFVNREYDSNRSYAVSGTLNFRLGSFILESKNIYDPYYVYNFRESVYFSDSLFIPNLFLKTGLTLNIIGPRQYYDLNSRSYKTINTDYTFDFTLAGEIRKSATIYFTWENILDRQYYVVAFYPMQGRNLRFGVAWELLN